MSDAGREETDELLERMEREIADVYSEARKELESKIDSWYERFQARDAKMREKVNKGELSEQDYNDWLKRATQGDKQYKAMLSVVSQDLTNADKIAVSVMRGYMPDAYAMGMNYGTYQIESGTTFNTNFTLYDRQTVERLLRDEPKLLPMMPNLNVPKDRAWNERTLNRQITQSIIQGESIPHAAKRIRENVGERFTIDDIKDKERKTPKQISRELERKNRISATRSARTALTGAENAGRIDSYKRAKDMGIGVKKQWLATLDDRTRGSHREIDLEVVEVDDNFSNGCEYPGDPIGTPAEVYNCRCTLIPWLDITKDEFDGERSSDLHGMSYDEWKHELSSRQEQEVVETTEQMEETPQELQKPKREEFEFVPATTLQDAEEYAKSLCNEKQFGAIGVSYKGIGLDVANEINKTVGKFLHTYDIEKFGGIFVPKGSTKLGQMIQGAHAAYSPIRNSFLVNSANKSIGVVEKALLKEKSVVTDFINNPNKYDTSKMNPRVLSVLTNSIESGRGTVPETMADIINHELGHSLETQIKKLDSYGVIVENMKDYASKISGYSTESFSEYIAESFCSYQRGEKIIDAELIRAFEALER